MALAKSGTYLLYDATNSGDGSGGGAEPMASAMQSEGFTKVYVLAGGFAAWKAAGYPTEAGGFKQL